MTDSERVLDTENSRAQLAMLAEVSRRLNLIETPDELCSYLCRQIKAIIGQGYCMVSLMDESGQKLTIKAIEALEDERLVQSVIRALGTDPRSLQFEVKDATPAELEVFCSGKLAIVHDGIYTLLTRRFPKSACSIVERLLEVKYVYTIGFTHNARYLGGLTILTASGEAVEDNRHLIEAIMPQCAIILDRMFAEGLLRKSESHFKALVEHAGDAIYMVDEASRSILDCNQQACDTLGYSREEILKLTTDDIEASFDKHQMADALAALKDKAFVTVEGEHKRKDGTIFPVEIRMGWLDASNRATLIAIVRDTTERKEAETALRQSRERLSRSEQIAGFGHWEFNFNNQKVKTSSGADLIYGLQGKEVTITEVQKIPLPEYRQTLDKALDGLVKQNEPYDIEFKIKRQSDGQIRYIHSIAKYDPVRNVVFGVIQDITALKQAEAAVRQSEERFRRTFDQSPIGIAISGLDFRFNRVNQTMCQMLGYSEAELTALTFKDITHPDDLSQDMVEIQRLKDGEIERYERDKRYVRKDGVIFWGHLSIGVIKDESGQPQYYTPLLMDITESKRAEDELKASEEKYHSLFNNAEVGMFRSTMDGSQMLDMNQKFTQIFGSTREEMLKTPPVNYWTYPAEREEMTRLLKVHGSITDFECHMRTMQGGARDCLLSLRLYPESGLIEGSMIDITERKRAERLLAENEARLRTLVQTIPDLIWLKDTAGVFLACNAMFERYFGAGEAQIIGKTDYDFVDKDLADSFRGHDRQAMAAGKPTSNEEWVTFADDGHRALLDTIKTPMFDADGKLIGVLGIARDITEFKKAESEILRLNQLYAVISQVNQAVVRAKTQEQFLETVCRVITEYGGFKLAWVGQADFETKRVMPVAAAGPARDYVTDIVVYMDDRPEGRGPTGTAVRELKPYVQNDFMNDPNTAPWHARAKPFGFHGSASFPILMDGQAWGAISVYSDTIGYFGDREKRLIEEAAGDIGFALQNFKKEKLRLWAEDALRKGTEELGLLYEASRELSRSLDLKEVCRTLLGYISRAMPFDRVMVSSFDQSDQTISCLYAFDKDLKEIDSSHYPPMELGPAGSGTQSAVIHSGTSLLLEDYAARNGSRSKDIPEDVERTRSAIIVPLKSENRVIGVIQVFSNHLKAFTPENLRMVEALSVHAAAAITNALLYTRVQKELAERQEAEEALRRSEERFRSLYENSNIGIYRTTPDGRILLANPALVNMLGYSSFGEMADKNLNEEGFEPAYSRNIFLERIEASGEIKGLESLWKHRDGSVKYIRESARAIRDSQGQTLYYDGVVEDITERKQIEKALMESEEKFRNLAEQSPNIIFINVGGRIVYANNRASDMMGYSQAEFYSPEFDFTTLVAPEYAAEMKAFLAKHMQGNEMSPLEYALITRAGKRLDAILTTRLIDYQGERAVLGTITDISERKKAEEERRQLEEKAQVSSRLAAVGEMAAGIAHEINNPLTSLIGFSELLMEQDLPQEIKEEVKIIAEGSRRVAEIVKRLLTFARQNKPVRTALNINALIDNTLKLRTYVLQTANIRVYTCYDQTLPWIAADPGQLQQVFLNIIVNAEQAMKSAHNGGELRIITERHEQYLRITFQDDGPGITKENLARLFQPFFTTKAPGEGTGLGLSLSRSIVVEHGGEMRAESQPEQGATFIVELPLSEATVSPQASVTPRAAVPSTQASTARILVVDDEPSVRDYLRVALTTAGYLVDSTGDPEEALEIINENSYGLVFLDIRMPGMSGTELYGRIMQKFPALARKIIFMTGDTYDAGVKAFLTHNNLPFLSKPFEAKALEDKVRTLLESE